MTGNKMILIDCPVMNNIRISLILSLTHTFILIPQLEGTLLLFTSPIAFDSEVATGLIHIVNHRPMCFVHFIN